jgi:hypothetical protein
VRPANAATVHCPYCYDEFKPAEIEFRCSGRPGRSRRPCASELDAVLADRTGRRESLPHVFSADGLASSAVCEISGASTTMRVCPACHSWLPVHFGQIPSRMIALVGAKETGKTVFMTVLVHELMHSLGRQLGASISGADDFTRRSFASEYEYPLYTRSRLPAPNPPVGQRNLAPLVFRLTTGACRRVHPADRRLKQTLLSFLDPAGEDLRSRASVEHNARYLAAADGIMLLLDPLQMPDARKRAVPGARLPTQSGPAETPALVLENITDLIMSRGKAPGEPIAKPLAIVFSKIDALQHDFKETSPLRQPDPRKSYASERDSLRVHAEVRRLLDRWDGAKIDQLAQQHYLSYRYFGVSALGGSPASGDRVSERGISPYRVGSPFVWLLGRLGAIPVKRV